MIDVEKHHRELMILVRILHGVRSQKAQKCRFARARLSENHRRACIRLTVGICKPVGGMKIDVVRLQRGLDYQGNRLSPRVVVPFARQKVVERCEIRVILTRDFHGTGRPLEIPRHCAEVSRCRTQI